MRSNLVEEAALAFQDGDSVRVKQCGYRNRVGTFIGQGSKGVSIEFHGNGKGQPKITHVPFTETARTAEALLELVPPL